MAGIRGLLALLGLAAAGAEVRAQVIVVPNPYLGSPGAGFFYGRSGRHARLAFMVGAYNPYFGAPYASNTISQVTVVYTPPPIQQTSVVINAAPRILRLDDLGTLDPDLRADPPPERRLPPPDPQLPGGRDAGPFRPLAPDNRERANRPVPPDPQPRPDPRPDPQPPPDKLPRPLPPDANPKAEGEQQLKLGREAFAAREYGRAIQRFRDAAKRLPDDATPLFLLGQGLFAAGRYPEAVEAIRAGVGLRPDWPGARFAPRDLYGPNAADFADHMRRLREALDLLPDDPVLLFLYGYELWFDGRQEEARPLFRRARPAAADPAVIDRFLARPVL
jgi:hypothetical protein